MVTFGSLLRLLLATCDVGILPLVTCDVGVLLLVTCDVDVLLLVTCTNVGSDGTRWGTDTDGTDVTMAAVASNGLSGSVRGSM